MKVCDNGFHRPSRMPAAMSDMIASWPEVFKSPFGNSFYSMEGKTWDYTPNGCFRVADHWNFHNRDHIPPNGDRVHCPTDRRPKPEHWALARWNGRVWVILVEEPRTKRREVKFIDRSQR